MKTKCAMCGKEWTTNSVCPPDWVKLINEHAGHEWKCAVCGNDMYVRTEPMGEDDEIVTEVYCGYCRQIFKPM